MKFHIHLLLLLALTLISQTSIAQCSDAGICQIDKYSVDPDGDHRVIGLDLSYGFDKGFEAIVYKRVGITGELLLWQNLTLLATVPFSAQTFSGTTIAGIGDITLTADILLQRFEQLSKLPIGGVIQTNPLNYLHAQFGGKFATGSTTTLGLPLRYQSGSGTNDLMVAAEYVVGSNVYNEGLSDEAEKKLHPESLRNERLVVGIGFQLPLGIINNHVDSIRRGSDFFGRISLSESYRRLHFSGELLAIKRLSKARQYLKDGEVIITTSEQSPDPIDTIRGSYLIPASDPFQLNIRASIGYDISDRLIFDIGAAIPILKRDFDEDGLRRSYTAFATLKYVF